MPLRFNRDFAAAHGTAVQLAPGIRRMTARNAGPFTFHGTNSYLVGRQTLAVIDPGPQDDTHLAALLAAIGGQPVSHILVTHTHRDHSPLAMTLRRHTGARILGIAMSREAGDTMLDAGNDESFAPDEYLEDGTLIEGDGWALEVVTTPGHASNHAAFALRDTSVLFSGDHVMGWSTTVVAPPDGSMRDYMHSLDKLLDRTESRYLPGHGGEIPHAHKFVRGLRAHRRMRERAVLARLAAGDRTLASLVHTIYRDTDPRLHNAAALSLLAHLQDLESRGKVEQDSEQWFLRS